MSRRSFINLISNTVHLPDLDHVPIVELLTHRFPLPTLLSFLHEVTHHWCFDSAIGLAQSLIYADAMEAMFRSATDRSQSVIARDRFVRFSIVEALLDPIYEGLALFSEQNLVSLDSEAVSPPFVITGVHYGIALDEQFFKELSTLLVRCRRTLTNTKRKAELLCLPGDPGRSPYLSGYMTVLACFYRAAKQTPAFRDPDLFFIYFKAFFFEDLEFAAVLLCFDLAPDQYSDHVSDYIHRQLLRFMIMDHTENAATIEQQFRGRLEVRSSFGGDPIGDDYVGIGCSVEGALLGRDLLNKKFRELMTTRTSDLSVGGLLSHMIANRSFLRLLCRRVWIKNRNGTPLLFETEKGYSEAERNEGANAIPLPTTTELPDGPAFLECICVRLSSAFVLRKADEDEPGEVLTILGPPLEGISELPRFSHTSFDGWARVGDPLLPTRDQRDADHIAKMSEIIKAATSSLFEVFSPAVKFHHDHKHPISEEFMQQGFLGVIGDRSLVKAAACISILSFQGVPAHLRIESITEYWDWLVSTGEITRTFREAVEDLLKIRERSGWKLLEPVDDHFALTLNF